MASPYQQQALQRKLIYSALILVLFTVAWAWRHYVVDVQAADLAIREQNRGEVELTGALVRLGLTGSRGFATCGLWWIAMDKQKKNQWNELEVIVRSLTKLQPHFIRPWLFQSWNLAYNVSVEADRVGDKYFFITRGIDLLAEGERQNQNYPDLRWYIGFYNQHKICQSDETNTLRSMGQLSCIPPNERDPARFQRLREGKPEINEEEFEKFCRKHPQLVRRLREGMRRDNEVEQRRQFKCATLEDVLTFLTDNYRLPSRWEDAPMAPVGAWQVKEDKLKPVTEQFPLLPPYRESVPPPQHIYDTTALHDQSQLTDEDDTFQVARAWYCYAQEPVPDAGEMPGSVKEITDRKVQRRPRQLAPILFRAYPAHAQRYTAERLEQEGWFDEEGYILPDWFTEPPAPIGGGRTWAQDAWQRALRLWQRLGESNHLLVSPSEEENLRQMARELAEKYNLPVGTLPPEVREDSLDEATRRQYQAVLFLQAYERQRTLGNFPSHYAIAEAESKKETVQARKLFFEAETLRMKGSLVRALKRYEDPRALQAWRDKVLLQHPGFRSDSIVQETTFEIQLRYLDLYTEVNKVPVCAQRSALAAAPMQSLPMAGAVPLALAGWLPSVLAQDDHNPILGGPFDGNDKDGRPLLEDSVRSRVLDRQRLAAPASPPQPPAAK